MRTVNIKNKELVEIKKDGKTIYRILAENGLIAISEMPNEMEIITGNRASQYISAKEGIEKTDEHLDDQPPCECGETNAAWYGSMAGSRIWRCQNCFREEERRKAMRDLERERKEKICFLKEMNEAHDYCPVCNGLLRKSTNAGTDCFCSVGMLKDYFGV